jgi:hypothetical protein
VDIAGNQMASGNLDTEIFIEGTASVAEVAGSTRAGMFYEYATTQDFSNNHVYFWLNCGVVGLLSAKASQGMTFRIYTTDPVTNYAEWDIGGSDSWPSGSVQGGWTLFCIDLESTPSRTSGTAPSTSAVLGLGVSFITDTMPRMVNNTWIDGVYRLADGNPAVIVEGKNGGTTAWTWADLPAQLGVSSGVAQEGPGGTIILNGPVEFFTDDGTDHAFNSTNETVIWATHEFIATDFYGITVLGANTGSADFQMGIKTGTGNDATGAQGGAIIAGANDVRWFFDADIANIDSCNMYGVQLIHGGDFQIDSSANSWISCSWIDCTGATVNNAEILSCSIVDANTADGVAFMVTDDIGDIVNCSFEFSDGHAIEITATTVDPQNNVGNLFSGYTNSADSNDAAIYLSEAGNPDLTINSSGGTNLQTNSWRTAGTGTVTISQSVTVTLTFVDDTDGSVIEGMNVILGTTLGGTDVIDNVLTNASGVVSVSYSGSTPQAVSGYAAKGTQTPVYERRQIGGTIDSNGLTQTIRMNPD